MSEENFYLLNEGELMRIGDLCETLGLAIDKIIRGRRIIRECGSFHPAVKGYEKIVSDVLLQEDDDLDEIF